MKLKFENDIALGMIQQSRHMKISDVDWTTNTAIVKALDAVGQEQLRRFLGTKIAREVFK